MKALQIFRLVAPEFAELADSTILNWLELNRSLLSRERLGADYEQAWALLTAHRLKLSLSDSVGLGSQMITSYREGDLSLGFAQMPTGDWVSTAYGQQLAALEKAHRLAIVSAGQI